MIEVPERPFYLPGPDGSVDIDWEAVNYDYRLQGANRAYRDGWSRIFGEKEEKP